MQMPTLSDWIEDAATKSTMLDLADQYAQGKGGQLRKALVDCQRH